MQGPHDSRVQVREAYLPHRGTFASPIF